MKPQVRIFQIGGYLKLLLHSKLGEVWAFEWVGVLFLRVLKWRAFVWKGECPFCGVFGNL
jgi:hypothetical protein